MFSTWLAAFDSPEGRRPPTSRLIVPTAPGTRESLDSTSTGSEDEKQAVDVDVAIGTTTQSLEHCEGCSYESTFADIPVSFLFSSTGMCVVMTLLVPTDVKPNSGPIPAEMLETCATVVLPEAILLVPFEMTEAELQNIQQCNLSRSYNFIKPSSGIDLN